MDDADDAPDQVDGFIVDAAGPPPLFGVFEDDGTTGYLYVYDTLADKILRDCHVYNCSDALEIEEREVDVVWSVDHGKCGVVILGQVRAIIDLAVKRQCRAGLTTRDSPGIRDREWISGFPGYR
jgi:hypothetical protein